MLQFSQDLKQADVALQCIASLQQRVDLSKSERHWLDREFLRVSNVVADCKNAQDVFDIRWCEIKARVEENELDLRTLEEYLDDASAKISDEDRQILRDVVLHPRKRFTEATQAKHRYLVAAYREKANTATGKMADLYEHLYDRLAESTSLGQS